MELTSAEQEITKIFIERANVICKQYDMNNPDWKCSIKFLMARKFDINRALQLYRNHETIREKEDLKSFDPFADIIRKELSSTKFSIIIPKNDPSFPTIAIFRAKLHEPTAVSTKTVLRALIFQLDCALDSLQTQRNGLIFVYDMADSKYRNFDLDLSQKILNLLKGAYPARLKKILILSAPLWFRAPFNLLRLIIPEKLWSRVWICEPSQLPFHIPLGYLPVDFGGTAPPFDHRGWLMHCFKCYTADKQPLEPYDPETQSQHSSPLFRKPGAGENANSYDDSPYIHHNPPPLTDKQGRKGTPELISLAIPANVEREFNTSLPMVLSPPPFGNKALRNSSSKCSPTPNHVYRSLSTTPTVTKEESHHEPSTFKFPGKEDKDTHVCRANLDPIAASSLADEFVEDPFEIESPDPELNFLPPSGKETVDITGLIHHVIEIGGKDGLYKEYTQLTSELNEFHKLRRLHLRKMVEKGLYPGCMMPTPSSTPPPTFYSFETFAVKSNATKNRYSDVMCFDHSRVVIRRKGPATSLTNNAQAELSSGEGETLPEDTDDSGDSNHGLKHGRPRPVEDYINANYVDGFNRPRAYISTQGPLPKTFEDFWCMCWENRVLTIVMTTKVSERGRVKCGEYWPTKMDSTLKYGSYLVKLTERNMHPSYIISQLELRCNKDPNEPALLITHVQFTSWPDYGVPSSALELLSFRDMVEECQAHNYDRYLAQRKNQTSKVTALIDGPPPIVVHCSAGIGRTGTFITIDICIKQLVAFGKVNVRHVVRRIRSQRAFSIQMPDQYVFCHTAILEYANREGMIPKEQIESFKEAIKVNQED